MIIPEYIDNESIRIYSDRNKMLSKYDKNGNLLVEAGYEEVINFGKIINGVGIFDNGNTYKESDVDIPTIKNEKINEV